VTGAAGGRIERARAAGSQRGGRRERPRTDDLAAAVILQAYIDSLEQGPS
jgi:hypothetical protein